LSRTVSSKKKRVCIVTNGSISQGPRVQKEADSLAGADYDVSVISSHCFGWTIPLDEVIASRSLWRSINVIHHKRAFAPAIRHYFLRGRNRLFRQLFKYSHSWYVPELASSQVFLEHLVTAVRQKADIYIGHNLQSLSVVCLAARLTGGRSAFDAEDLHCGELEDGSDEQPAQILAQLIQHKYLRQCGYVTASSPGIARALVERYNIPHPTIVLNTFPLDLVGEAQAVPLDRSSGHGTTSFYWYSQIVSLDRGLQDAIIAIGRLENNAELHIRGNLSTAVRGTLEKLAEESGSAGRVFFHEAVPPEELLSYGRQHDVGLCLETTKTVNRNLCITNKMFLYLVAGLAIIATRTEGHSEVFKVTPDIGHQYDDGDVDSLVRIMTRLAREKKCLQDNKICALRAARDHWNWAIDERRLLERVEATCSI